MKSKIKKITLICLVSLILFTSVPFNLSSGDIACGCADSYMGAGLIYSICHYVGGEMVWRRCVYAY